MSGTGDNLDGIGRGAGGAAGSVETLTNNVNKLAQGLETLSNAGFQTEKGFDNLANGLKNIAGSTAEFTTNIDNIMSKVPGLGTVASAALKPLSLVATTIEHSIGAMHGAMTAAMQVMDASSKPFRTASDELWKLERAFAGSFETADKFTETLLKTVATPFARQTYLSTEALQKMAAATAGTSIQLSELNKSIDTAAGSQSLLAVATAHAASMGMEATTYMNNLNKAMNRQGMSAQEAVEQMAMFGAVASETGLNITDVSQTLNSAASGFEKIGMSADFGKPFIEGFTSSLTSMGFGVENALSLTQSLSSALGKLTDNYGLAYITFQRGGLDIGGGGGTGVLGSSIGLQSAMMDAEQTGDQSNIAATLAGGLRDTLASFTGGSVVTVGEAAENPAMQAAFYTQQQLLTKQYGMDQQTATRTLEMLSGLDDAIQSGDTDMQKELQSQISEQMNADNKNMDLQEKMNRGIGSAVALLMANNRMMYEQTRMMGDETVGGWISAGQGGIEQLDQWLQSTSAAVSESGGMTSLEGANTMRSRTTSREQDMGAERARAALESRRPGLAGKAPDSQFARDFRERERYVQELEATQKKAVRTREEAEINAGYERETEGRRSLARKRALEEGEVRAGTRTAYSEDVADPSSFGGAWSNDWESRDQERVSRARGGALVTSGETNLSVISKSLLSLLDQEDPVRRVEIIAGDDLISLRDSMREVTGERT